MTAPTPSRELVGSYSEALLAYVTHAGSPALLRAREIANTALVNGLCGADLCAIHHESLRQLGDRLHGEQNHSSADQMSAAGAFLAETLAALETGRRDLSLLNTALRRQNDRLESELRRVSRLMYDEALQLVSATRLAIADSVRDAPPMVWNLLERLEEQLTSCSGSLQPRILEDLGLVSAIQYLSRRFATACQLDVVAETAIGPLPAAVSIALYRAVLEALTNVHRHARATSVRIRLCEECSTICCSIRDDGVGFDISRALSEAETQGSGFVMIQENLRLVGGTLVVDSVPGGGTELRISICPGMSD
jgi:signal transduction histidine kinase